MENYTWDNYPFTDQSKGLLGYVVQNMLNTQYGKNIPSYTSYENPYTGRLGAEEQNEMGYMNDRAINTAIEALRNNFAPALQARREYKDLPDNAKRYYIKMFDFPGRPRK